MKAAAPSAASDTTAAQVRDGEKGVKSTHRERELPFRSCILRRLQLPRVCDNVQT